MYQSTITIETSGWVARNCMCKTEKFFVCLSLVALGLLAIKLTNK